MRRALRRSSILGDKLNFKSSCWEGISDEARNFVSVLLHKDPEQRPSAKEALQHPWLRGTSRERSVGRPLSLAVVQRIQARTNSWLGAIVFWRAGQVRLRRNLSVTPYKRSACFVGGSPVLMFVAECWYPDLGEA